MKSAEKQLLRSLYVMHSYICAEIIRIEKQLPCTEDAIRELWRVKTENLYLQNHAPAQNFLLVT